MHLLDTFLKEVSFLLPSDSLQRDYCYLDCDSRRDPDLLYILLLLNLQQVALLD